MDTTNRPESNLPARISSTGARLPSTFQATPITNRVTSAAPTSSISPSVLLRGLVRHWWHILGMTLLVSLPAVYAIYVLVEPKYEAQGMLRVEPTKPNVYGANMETGERGYAENFLRTQLNLINSHGVLEKVATNLEVKDYPLIKDSKDYFVDLGKALTVEAVKDTFLIRVSLQSEDPKEAYDIVKAVISAYMAQVKEYARVNNSLLIKSFQDESTRLKNEIKVATDELITLAGKGHIQNTKSSTDAKGGGAQEQQPDSTITNDKVTEEQYAKYRSEYIETAMELDAAEIILKKRKELESDLTRKAEIQQEEQTVAEAEIDQQVEAEFLNDPEVKGVVNEIDDKEKELARVGKIARQSANEPAMKWIRQEIEALEKQYRKLWETKYDGIRKRMLADHPGMGVTTETLKELEQKVVDLRAHKDTVERFLKSLTIENQEARVDAIKAELKKKQVDVLNSRLVLIDNHLKQAMFEAGTEQVRVSIADEVKMPISPSQNKRIKLMAITPIAFLAVFLGLFLLLEIKAERVSDPEALSTRVQSEVFALPPLPSAREVRKMRELENGSDQIDRFIQRLDHLRFAVCGSQTPLDNGRCVLVTSAVGGEGKTTLAAQLAARCGNAGMSTLLIDADLRRSSLGTLLDVADGPGLSDVLRGDITLEEAAIPVQGGTFHLLLAGTPIEDVSRILHGDNFGILIARLRELYDLIVIDSPPVLPVPDALILGQWADGAILASRFDISRFPQVERARRQLDISGITVLGTVINGMRSSDAYYGHYSYNRKKGAQPDSSNAN